MAELLLVTADDPRKTMALGVEKKKKNKFILNILEPMDEEFA